MNKKILLTCFVSLGILGGGTFAYSSLSSAQEVQEEGTSMPTVSPSDVSSERKSIMPESNESSTSQTIATSSSELQSTEASVTPPSSIKETTTSDNQTSETSSTMQNTTPPVLTKIEQEHNAFAKEAVKQDFYLEAPDANGKLTYVKATDEKVKELTEDAENNKVSIYQVEHNGEMISVLSVDN